MASEDSRRISRLARISHIAAKKRLPPIISKREEELLSSKFALRLSYFQVKELSRELIREHEIKYDIMNNDNSNTKTTNGILAAQQAEARNNSLSTPLLCVFWPAKRRRQD